MKSANGWLWICLVILGGCRSAPPVVEWCIIGDEGCICTDQRIGKEPYVRPFPECVNYIATNPTDFQSIMEWGMRRGARP